MAKKKQTYTPVFTIKKIGEFYTLFIDEMRFCWFLDPAALLRALDWQIMLHFGRSKVEQIRNNVQGLELLK